MYDGERGRKEGKRIGRGIEREGERSIPGDIDGAERRRRGKRARGGGERGGGEGG